MNDLLTRPGDRVPEDCLAIALDYPDRAHALQMAEVVRGRFGVAKIGLELFSSCGPEVVEELRDSGFRIFVDLKLYDIPNTVYRAASTLADVGASLITVHSAGGLRCMRAAVEGAAEGGASPGAGGSGGTAVIAVTVLTSEEASEADLLERASLAAEAGCAGVVCGVPDLALLSGRFPDLATVVPGIRLSEGGGAAGRGAGVDSEGRGGSWSGGTGNAGGLRGGTQDQVRTGTPGAAIAAGAGLLVVGRAVTAAADPKAAATAVYEEVRSVLAGS